MSESPDESIAQLEDQLDGASRTLSSLHALNARLAERVAARMDRLASQLLEVSPPAGSVGVVAVIAHMRGLRYLRLVATLAFLSAVVALVLGGFGGSLDGGLIDQP